PAEGDVRGIVLNPMGETERYPFNGLCGTGVAFKLACALEMGGVAGDVATDTLLDLFAVATIGDLSPLVDENRYLVRAGLGLLNGDGRLGFGALKAGAGLDKPEIHSYHIGFILAPRLNAPGRIGNAKPALEILCTNDAREAAELARTLELNNNERKLLTEVVHEEVLKMIEEMPDKDRRGGFVLAGEGWNEGVLGIAASRIVDEFGKPVVLIGVDGPVGKGSGRSVPGVQKR
ncbi:MAG: single-stranded-DNA-specific exonuclease RecJ, partial [bacterium]